jgi:hypothetical protein
VPIRAAPPHQGEVDADPKGVELGTQDSNLDCTVQGPADCHYLSPHQSRLPVPTRISRFTGARPQPCAAAKVCSAGVESQHLASRASRSAGLAYEHSEPPLGVEPSHPPYEGEVTSRV